MVSPPESESESVSPLSSPPRARVIKERNEPPPLNRVGTRRSRILAARGLKLVFEEVAVGNPSLDPSLDPPLIG